MEKIPFKRKTGACWDVTILSSLSRSFHSLPTVPLRYTLTFPFPSKSIPTSVALGSRHHNSTKMWCFKSAKHKSYEEIFACVCISSCIATSFELLEIYWETSNKGSHPHCCTSWLLVELRMSLMLWENVFQFNEWTFCLSMETLPACYQVVGTIFRNLLLSHPSCHTQYFAF